MKSSDYITLKEIWTLKHYEIQGIDLDTVEIESIDSSWYETDQRNVGALIHILNCGLIFFFLHIFSLLLDNKDRNAYKLQILAACLKLDDVPCHKALDSVLPSLPPAPWYPNAKVAELLSSLLGEGYFLQNVQLPHNHHIGMRLDMIYIYFILFSILSF